MAQRLNLDEKLRSLLSSSNVYFQPPENLKMKYPCFRYRLSGADQKYASDNTYSFIREYELMHIHTDPDTNMPELLSREFKNIRFDRRYSADNLYHDVYTLYY